MTYLNVSPAWSGDMRSAPVVRTITMRDLRDALRQGVEDFRAMPTHAEFLAVIYPLVGIFIARVTMGDALLPLAYPFATGFALLGPFAALGLYELSRRRESGAPVSWTCALALTKSPALPAILTVAGAELVLFVVWIVVAQLIYAGLIGDAHPHSMGNLLTMALTTPAGWALVILGNAIGLAFAVVSLTLSVVSFPLLLDRHVDARTAIATSIQAVRANPGPMAMWGLIVGAALFAGSLPLFVGLAIVLPVLGHATWHLYRKVVVPAGATI